MMGFDIKPMTVDEMILALDRISRFKYPENKLKRVYVETICSHFLKIGKKDEIELLEYDVLSEMFTKIWNFSVKTNFGSLNNNFELNDKYIKEEKNCYFLSNKILKLMPQKADFLTLVSNIKKVPNNFDNYKTPQKIVLTEGITEEILLPEFLNNLEYNCEKYGIKIVGTGGKSRILNLYAACKEQIKVPVYILIDKDAESIYKQIKPILRDCDFVHLIKSGEIEDIIPITLFKRAINSEFKNQTKISVNDFDKTISIVDNLHNIYKNNGLGEFKKAKMAQMIKSVLNKTDKLSDEMLLIINEIKSL